MIQRQSITLSKMNLSFDKKEKSKLTVIWVVREPQHLTKYIDDIINVTSMVIFKIYITGKFSKDDEIKHKLSMINILSESNIECYFYKPDVDEMIPKYDKVYFCGPRLFECDVRSLCKHYGVEFHCEKFD